MRVEIPKATELEQKVFSIDNEKHFLSIALEVFDFQFNNNLLYNSYCRALGRTPGVVQNLADIPFLPISFFKSHEVKTGQFSPELVFKSSGTTGQASSSHLVRKAGLYEKSFLTGFHEFFGPLEEYCILGLLPSYLERGNSSLVYMVDQLIRKSGH